MNDTTRTVSLLKAPAVTARTYSAGDVVELVDPCSPAIVDRAHVVSVVHGPWGESYAVWVHAGPLAGETMYGVWGEDLRPYR